MKFTYVYCFLTHPEVSWPLSHLPPFGKVPGVLSCKQHGPFVLALFSPLSYTLGLTVKSSDWVSGWCWVIHNLHASLCCIRTIRTEHTSHTRKTDTVNPICEGKQKPHTVDLGSLAGPSGSSLSCLSSHHMASHLYPGPCFPKPICISPSLDLCAHGFLLAKYTHPIHNLRTSVASVDIYPHHLPEMLPHFPRLHW